MNTPIDVQAALALSRHLGALAAARAGNAARPPSSPRLPVAVTALAGGSQARREATADLRRQEFVVG